MLLVGQSCSKAHTSSGFEFPLWLITCPGGCLNKQLDSLLPEHQHKLRMHSVAFSCCACECNFAILCCQTAIKKNNPRKYLRSVGDGETVEFDVVEGEKVKASGVLEHAGKSRSAGSAVVLWFE